MYIWLLIWLLCILYGFKPCSTIERSNVQKGLSYANTLPLRGFLAIEIMFGHMYGYLQDNTPVIIGSRIGVLVVGAFFLFSGWGLYESVHNKPDYMNGFLRRHFRKIFIPVFCLYLFKVFVLRVDFQHFTFENFIQDFFPTSFFDWVNWYVYELLVLYFIFYALYKHLRPQTATFILFAICLMFIVISGSLEIGSKCYGSTLCFVLGIYLSQSKNAISNILKQHGLLLLFTCGGAFCIFTVLFICFESSLFANTLFICLSTLFFCCTLIIVLTYFRFGNKITLFLGNISFEIYIIHESLIKFWRSTLPNTNDIIYSTLVITSTVFIAWLSHTLIQAGYRMSAKAKKNRKSM